jgi:hypothetical protein
MSETCEAPRRHLPIEDACSVGDNAAQEKAVVATPEDVEFCQILAAALAAPQPCSPLTSAIAVDQPESQVGFLDEKTTLSSFKDHCTPESLSPCLDIRQEGVFQPKAASQAKASPQQSYSSIGEWSDEAVVSTGDAASSSTAPAVKPPRKRRVLKQRRKSRPSLVATVPEDGGDGASNTEIGALALPALLLPQGVSTTGTEQNGSRIAPVAMATE